MTSKLESRMMNGRIFVGQRHHIKKFLILLLLFALVNLAVAIILGIIYTPLAKQYGIYLSLWWDVIIPAIAIVVMYLRFGVPLVRSQFRQPLSRRAIILQALGGLFVLPPLAILAEIGIIFLAKLASPLSAIPIIGVVTGLGSLIPSYRFGIIMMTTAIAAILGVWCSLTLYWFVQKIRSLDRSTAI